MTVKLKKPHVDEADQLHKIAAGTRQYLANLKAILVLGKSITPASLATQLDTYGNTVGTYQTAVLALKVQRAELVAMQPTIRAMVNAVHSVVEGSFGPISPVLTDFGFTPAKTRQPKTGQEMVSAAAKGAETRQILGTKGPKQKQAALDAARSAGGASPTAPAGSTTPASAPAAGPAAIPPATPPTAEVAPSSAPSAVSAGSPAAEIAAVTAASPIGPAK